MVTPDKGPICPTPQSDSHLDAFQQALNFVALAFHAFQVKIAIATTVIARGFQLLRRDSGSQARKQAELTAETNAHLLELIALVKQGLYFIKIIGALAAITALMLIVAAAFMAGRESALASYRTTPAVAIPTASATVPPVVPTKGLK